PRITNGPGFGNSSLFTQELRVASPTGAKLEYTAGMFYSAQRQFSAASPFNINVILPFPPFTIPVVARNGTQTNLSDDSFAVFGQTTFHADEHLRLIAGARYTGERLAVRYRSADTGNTGIAKSNIENFSWRVGAQYEFDRNLMVYGTVSRGYKGPQIALGDPSLPTNIPTIIRPEIPTNYEIGLKGSLADGRLIIDLNAFLMNLKDYQGQICNPNASGGLTCAPQNISRVRSKGVELNVTGRPAEGLVMNAGLIYNAVRYPAGFQGSNGLDPNATTLPLPTISVDLGGLQLVSAPEWKATFSGEYSHEVTGGLEAFLGVDVIYKSKLRLAASTRPETIFGAHATLG
ncbi:MAG: TonB-dependent receptor, partial [Hyphomicrobiales bacterium]